jgi:hypothetical protein
MSPRRATCLTQFFLLNLIALIIFDDNTKNVASDFVILYTFHILLGMLKVAVNMFRSLLYSKSTHAILLNTLSHPHFNTLKLLKNVL